ncbi:uridine phosphorylase [Catalinimonas alkaloidigena]|uniref:nucleoside phosphorylase n=1 Tax=Catalinimonas alkaloidigena TaxID=1075417 RepID=UPI0024067C99|nr:nucleoside phosphorylase [Catalinimonas alkaloidigena]MDF9796694.1 uridine phosphorylase [Catalinimonas alkaloidigena]
MKDHAPSSEIILNADGSIYHLGLRPEHLTDFIITVGDPERVAEVSKYFDSIDVMINKREFVSHIGRLGKKNIMVISSGMGTDNVEILLTELDILANVNLSNLNPNAEHRTLTIIRVGTSGALRKDVPLDSLLMSDYAFGLDTLMHFYGNKKNMLYSEHARQLQQHMELSFEPYCERANETLKSLLTQELLTGNTLTCPGFYAPQGRRVKLPLQFENYHEKLKSFSFDGGKLTNFEMETAGYYALGKALGHKVLSTNAIVANRETQKFSVHSSKTIDKLIRTVLSKISGLD